MHRFAVLLLASGCHRLLALEEVPDASPVADDAAADGLPACPADYASSLPGVTTSKYRYSAQPVTWDAAAEACALSLPGHTHLVVIESDVEREALIDMFVTDQDVWIGLSDRVTDTVFLWVTEQPTPQLVPGVEPWAPNRPDGSPENEQDCVRFRTPSNNLYDDAPCETPYPFLCECDAWPDDRRRY